MKDTIYLVISRRGVSRMNKSVPVLSTGEFPLKLEVEVNEEAFRNPIVTKKVVVNDWREGIDIADVDFKETFITPEEAGTIKAQRLQKMQQILESQGYTVSKPLGQDGSEQ